MSPSDNASGAFDGEAHISRRGGPSLRLTAWRAVWPMLIHNEVMAAKYQAMTAAADRAAADSDARDGGRAWPAPPRCCAGFTPSGSTAPAGTPPSQPAARTTRTPPVTCRRPAQPDAASRPELCSGSCRGPALRQGAEPEAGPHRAGGGSGPAPSTATPGRRSRPAVWGLSALATDRVLGTISLSDHRICPTSVNLPIVRSAVAPGRPGTVTRALGALDGHQRLPSRTLLAGGRGERGWAGETGGALDAGPAWPHVRAAEAGVVRPCVRPRR